jgi:hypothetical protein
MWPPIIGFLLFIILVITIGSLFLLTVVELLVNGVIIYLAGIRGLKELNRGWMKEYAVGAIISIAVMAVKGNVIRLLWPFTTWLLLAFLIAQFVHVVIKK